MRVRELAAVNGTFNSPFDNRKPVTQQRAFTCHQAASLATLGHPVNTKSVKKKKGGVCKFDLRPDSVIRRRNLYTPVYPD